MTIENNIRFYNETKLSQAKQMAEKPEDVLAMYEKLAGKYEILEEQKPEPKPAAKKVAKKVTKKVTKKTTRAKKTAK